MLDLSQYFVVLFSGARLHVRQHKLSFTFMSRPNILYLILVSATIIHTCIVLPTFTGEVESAGYDIEGDTWAKGCVDVIHTQSHRHTYINDIHKQIHVHQQKGCKNCLYQKFRTLGSEDEKKNQGNWPLY